MPIYCCKNCGYIFEQESGDGCPDCGKRDIRPALESEVSEYNARQKENE